MGEYTFVVVAHCGIEDSDPAAVIASATSATFNQNTFPYLFTKVESVTISGNTSQTVQINMGRRKSSSFQVKITDPTPEDVASLQLIVSPTQSIPTAYSINPTTGFAPSDWKYQKTFPRSHYADNTFSNHTIALGILLTDTEQQLDVTINAFDADGGVLYTRTKTGVTFRQASTTRAQGTFFSSTADGSLIFDTTEGYIDITINALDTDGSVLYTRTKTGVTFRQASTTRAQGTFFSSTADGSLIFDTTEGYIDITL